MKYIISTILSLIVIAGSFFYCRYCMSRPYENSDDPAWEFRIGKKEAHLLAEHKGVKKSSEREALVQMADGSRKWAKVSELPHYYKLKAVDMEKFALVSSNTVDSVIIGKSFNEIEQELACACEKKGNKVVFPIKVVSRDQKLSSENVTITFKDTIATAVNYEMKEDKKAGRYSLLPGLFLLIDRGVKAPQRGGFASNLPEDEEGAGGKKGYHFGDFTVKAVSFVLKLAVILLGLLLLVSLPFIAALPVLFLYYDHFFSDEIVIAIGVVVELVFLYAFSVVCMIFNGPSIVIPIISLVVCSILTAAHYINS